MASIVRWYYDEIRDVIVVATTTMTYMLLYVGHLKNLVEVPPVPILVDLLEFL